MTEIPPTTLLADGKPPATPDKVLARLRELRIEAETMHHPPVFTVDQAKALRGDIPGCHTKNLFLRDKKGAMWLVVCLEDRTIDLKDLADTLGAKRLSFGSADRLMKYLGVIPGAVSPFAIFNDRTGAVTVAVDRAILEQEPLNFHPLDNSMTTSIGAAGFLAFLDAQGHPPVLVDLD